MQATLVVADLGVIDYDVAHELQAQLRDRKVAGFGADWLLLLEHPPVYTLGRGAALAHLGDAGRGTVPVRRVRRGGEVTFHGRGQLVGYPIIDLGRLAIGARDLHAYLRRLEGVLIRAVGRVGLAAGRSPGRTGVWVRGCKLASIGIGVRRWVTTHGFALNVSTDLGYFERIVPCGLRGVRMTSLSAEGIATDVATVGIIVAREFATEFGYASVVWPGGADRPMRVTCASGASGTMVAPASAAATEPGAGDAG
jgi:lipoyl(octanoyl) transferase